MSNSRSIAATTIEPPPFEGPNSVKLQSSKDGKITHVSVYPSRAHITRRFKLPLKIGQNFITISGLPKVLDDDSIRVEGNGEAIVQDITISTDLQTMAVKSPQLEALLVEKQRKENTTKRTEKAIDALATYLSTMNLSDIPPTDVRSIIQQYNEVTTEYQEDLIRQRKELDQMGQDIFKEHPLTDGKTATVGVFSESEEDIELSLHYVVTQAGWTPVYDLRVNTESKEKCIKLVYKASVTQKTGEEWKDVRLTLETSLPQFNVNLPPLTPWKLSFVAAGQRVYPSSQPAAYYGGSMSRRVVFKSCSAEAVVHGDPEDANAIATFEVLEPKTILGDGTVHKVAVTELDLDGELKWVSIPITKDVRMHWTAIVHNDSDYPLLKGAASVYVNGSFTARSEIPHVSPQERFNCALGVDPSIRVIYHPRDKKRSQSGFYTKSNNHIFEQRISLVNTKSCAVTNVKIIDHIPISEESTISVKLLSPALPIADPTSDKKTIDMSKVIQVAKGVVAQWEKGDGNAEVDKLGSDGKLSWNCSIPAQGKVNLVLSWEVAAPADKVITGL
ncbi:mucoidy inhibitor A [Cyathus striatus]|nr:mucoidy inhibitor A [Cyathus striatus]